MAQPEVSNPNDFKVVTFHNKTDFDFTPEMGCMYDGRPIFGISGAPCIKAGESIVLPYHVGNLLARNLAKLAMTKQAPTVDQAGIPTGVPLWGEEKLQALKNTFITDLYTEAKPTAMTETDKLMAKVEELKKFVETNVSPKVDENVGEGKVEVTSAPTDTPTDAKPEVMTYSDKADVIAELTKRGIKFDARSSKANLEKLLA